MSEPLRIGIVICGILGAPTTSLMVSFLPSYGFASVPRDH
jgi:hypothetical protein